MLFSSLAKLLTEKYPGSSCEVRLDCEISDVTLYDAAKQPAAVDCLCVFTPGQLAGAGNLPMNVVCVGEPTSDAQTRLGACDGNLVLIPEFSDRFMSLIAKRLLSNLLGSRSYSSYRFNMHQNILADLIKGAGEEEAVQRISVANLSFPPYMLAAVLRPSYFRESEFLHDVLMPAVSAILPNSPKLYQKGTIVALLESDRLGSVPEELMSQLRRLAAENGVLVGISNMFTRPERFAVYYRQAAQTAGFAKRQNNVSGVFLYSDCAFYLMLDGVEDKSMLEYAKHPLLSELEKYDAEKNTQLYDTLMTYTLTGFSKNRTAELMFLHRNTVNYRIQQISELYGLDFSDSAQMFKLQYSFHVDSYLKHRYLTPQPAPPEAKA